MTWSTTSKDGPLGQLLSPPSSWLARWGARLGLLHLAWLQAGVWRTPDCVCTH
eukprot:CAMPEP_0179166904 /NCGR_PEP_ID=MMETSP0796-20121207/82026_1 /TAXON_ID=73915 /ORGANISM="Pyrodinium bahamense, Strain pbaha01" /LENGTH=52 /DNA_ID=CAMNT_0020869541 /DNA_START=113 /DNA_END=268 /DNA_ORIENTATION=+